MKPYLIKTPTFIKFLFRNWLWSFSSKEKVLYLTFDDGPTPKITNWTLNTLQEYKAKATFFCIGKNVEKYPKIYQKILAKNHVVGNHTNNHLNGFKTNTLNYVENVNTSQSHFTENTMLFRPPYGKLKFSQAKKLREKGYKIVMWDVLSADFDTSISSEKCLENVIRNIKNGSIIVFHDSEKAKEKLQFVLPKVLDYYTKKGYAFKTIT
jgi:peptidoglycan/xylan/chitin deacetylase (PgdA/CDA1 family)